MTVPRVVVVGLIPRQEAKVKSKVGRYAFLQFARKDVQARFPSGTSHVVLATKFISHSVLHAAKKGSLRIHYANGGTGSVVQAVLDIARRQDYK